LQSWCLLLGEQIRLLLRIVLTYRMMNRSSWSMSEDDLNIWERVLEQVFSAVDTSAKAVDIIDEITTKCPAIGSRYVSGAVSLLIDMDFA
jgi:hypothetical protein